jgi:hypothetical protein
MIVSNLLTRRDIINLWMAQQEGHLDSYCCPNCRDLLIKDDNENTFRCMNDYCSYYIIELNKPGGQS